MISLRVLVFVILTVNGLDCEPINAGMNCTLIDKRLLCEVTQLSTDVFFDEVQWYQTYDSKGVRGSSIIKAKAVSVSAAKGKLPKFEIWIEQFDNQTYIYAQLFYSKSGKYLLTKRYQVNVTNKKHYNLKDKKTYSESEEVNFSCRYGNSRVGWIEPTGNTIFTYNEANHSRLYKEHHNGSMFCCLRYEIIRNEEKTLTRYLDDMTMLIYEKPSNQDNATTSTTTKQSSSMSTSSTTPHTNSVNSSRPNGDESTKIPYNHQPASTQKPTSTENHLNTNKSSNNLEEAQNTDQPLGSPSASDKMKYYVIIASVAGTILVASLIYVIVKKYTDKASDPEDPRHELQLETYASTNVVYAELDIKPSNAPVSATTEETPYAEIIGVLRPITENIKK